METSVRGVVLRYLTKAEAAGQYANLALDTALRRESLSAADKRLATALFYSVIEHRITLDAVIDGLSSIAPSAIERAVRDNLRLALTQLLYFDRIPDHAAINEAVELAPRRSKGFVNAVLREFCRGGKVIPLPCGSLPQRLSVEYSVTPPLVSALLDAFGEDRTERLLAALSVPPPITVRVNTTRLSREELLSRVEGAIPTKYAPHGVILPPNTELVPLIDAGLCFVQDEASQIAVAALGATEGMRVIDLCAAPGSKSFGAAMDMNNCGTVESFDLHENKLSLVRRGAERLGLSVITATAADARKLTPEEQGTFDRVICDVPCSGFGVLAKKPDLRYKDPTEALGLLPIQRDILEAAARMVKVGGALIYSTCTILPRENEEQVAAFLEKHGEFSAEPFAVGALSSDGLLTLAPDTHGTDGFFVAKLRRTY